MCYYIKDGSPSIPRKGLGVAQLVARYLGVVEAVGSSPVTQTIKTGAFRIGFFNHILYLKYRPVFAGRYFYFFK